MCEERIKETNNYITYVQRLVQGGLLGHNENKILYPFASVKWKERKDIILSNNNWIEPSNRSIINNNGFILPFITNDKHWWTSFFNKNNNYSCINFLFIWLCTEKHDKIFVYNIFESSDNNVTILKKKQYIDAFLFSLSTIIEAFNNCISLSNISMDHLNCLIFINYLKEIKVMDDVKILVEKQIEKGIDRLNVIYNMYVKFQIMNRNYDKSINTNGSILINAIDNLWKKTIDGESTINIETEELILEKTLKEFKLDENLCAKERLKLYKETCPNIIEPIVRRLYLKKLISMENLLEII